MRAGGLFFLILVEVVVAGILVVLVFLLVVIRILFIALAAEENEQDEHETEHGDENIRDVEDRQIIHKRGQEHILHIAAQQTVDAVGKSARHDEEQTPAADRGFDQLRCQRDDHENREHGAENDEEHARVLPAEEAEGGPVIMDVDDLEQTRDQIAGTGVERDVSGDPELCPLVENDDQQSNDGVQHNFLLSAADAALDFAAHKAALLPAWGRGSRV